MLRDSVVASATLAVAVTAVFAAFGQTASGMGIAAGLLLGSANGFAIQAFLGRDTPFLAASMFRLVTLSALGLLLALAFGISAWPVMIGVAGAQLVMVGAGVRQGLRA
ncbi:MAG TPA: hypothetical protein VHW94_09355 [Candidatus Dormibacteraeota bacterium]|jgi:hypothetical protein|nr:hypothetical protein [Candidatus Dormibacteraeota bacterium]